MKRLQFSLKTVFIIISIVAGLLAVASLVYRAYDTNKMDAARRHVKHSMRRILGVLHTERVMPPSAFSDAQGNATSSWRLVVAPYLWQLDSERPIDLSIAWNSPANATWQHASLPEYCFPHSFRTVNDKYHTNIFAVVGPGTVFDPAKKISIQELATNPATRDVIVLLEVRSSRTHWMQPGDFDIRTMPQRINVTDSVSGTCHGGFFVGFADEEVWFLRNDTPFDKLRMFLTIEGAQKNDRDQILGPYRLSD